MWGILKERIKKRLPKTIEELTKYTFEEWNSVPKSLIQNLCNNYIKKIEKVLKNGGARLEKEHLNELRKENEKKKRKKYLEYLDENIYQEKHKWELKNEYKLINIYNDQELLKKKKKEITAIKKYLKRIPSSFAEKIRKLLYPNKKEFISVKKIQKKYLTNLKNKTREQIVKLKNELEQMDLSDFLKYLKQKKNNFDEEDIAKKAIEEEEKKKRDEERDHIKKLLDELKNDEDIENEEMEEEMDIEKEEMDEEKKLKEEEKNDEESTIDGEITSSSSFIKSPFAS